MPKPTNTSYDICGSKPMSPRRLSQAPIDRRTPEDNNERQAIHEHVSIALTAAPTKKATAGRAAAGIGPAQARAGSSK